jgi:hypothetical protein
MRPWIREAFGVSNLLAIIDWTPVAYLAHHRTGTETNYGVA